MSTWLKIIPKPWPVLNLRDEWNGDNGNWIRRKANTLIREYPDLIAAYNLRYDVLGYETSIVAQAKEALRAFEAVREHYFSNEWPERMPYMWLENRPILTAIDHYAWDLWSPRTLDDSIAMYEQLLKMNPRDELGCRYCLFGILEGMHRHGFMKLTENGELMGTYRFRSNQYQVLKAWNDEHME
jgi:uncharacterized protein YqgV (UPF0045/DUF77 family)